MPHYTHGGDIWDKSGVLYDFSANLNPLGAPKAVLDSAAQADLTRYPDPFCTPLRRAIAARDGVSPAQVICGNGGADLIFRLVLSLRPQRALVTAPTFSEYEAALQAAGCRIDRLPLSPAQNFDLDAGILEAVTAETELCFVCTPNNPSGRLIPPDLLRALAARCAAVGAVLCVDQCFLPLSDHPEWGMEELLRRFPNVFLLRAFTKSYAIPGVRLGYGLGDPALLERLYAAGQPWSVSAPAQAAGLAACALPDWPQAGRAAVRHARPLLKAALESLGLTVFPGQANYLLFRAPGILDLKERMLRRGVLIRACAGYPGLGPDYNRVCVKTEAENEPLLTALKEAL